MLPYPFFKRGLKMMFTPTIPGNLPPLPKLILWKDPIARIGAECMAVDEVLLEWGKIPVLREYHWLEPTVTYGYFDSEETARMIFPDKELIFVRRWTGGGIVDHRADIPFTLAMHRTDVPARPTSAALYRWIHGALAKVLRECGVECEMLSGDAPNGGRACFSSPVTSDLVHPNGDKLAGGGQRRVRDGVLHQGSIQNCVLPEGWCDLLANRLAEFVTVSSSCELFEGMNDRVAELLAAKYQTNAWKIGPKHKAK